MGQLFEIGSPDNNVMRKPATFSPNNSKVQPNILPAPPVITSHIIPVRITSRSKSAYDKINYDSDKVRGHAPSNCIYINSGSNIMSKLPSFLVTNTCHITNKVDELASVIDLNNADITIVTESWLLYPLVGGKYWKIL